jgi:hypothetical protein
MIAGLNGEQGTGNGQAGLTSIALVAGRRSFRALGVRA